MLTATGVTSPELRRAAAAGEAVLPATLACYLDKLARAADTITDDDVRAVVQALGSEDAVFELTLSAAVGAAQLRLERGLAAVRGGGA